MTRDLTPKNEIPEYESVPPCLLCGKKPWRADHVMVEGPFGIDEDDGEPMTVCMHCMTPMVLVNAQGALSWRMPTAKELADLAPVVKRLQNNFARTKGVTTTRN